MHDSNDIDITDDISLLSPMKEEKRADGTAVRMFVARKYENIAEFVGSLPYIFESEGTYIYGGRRNLIKSFEAPEGTLLNVKRFHKPKGINLLVYSWGIRKPKGWRAYTYPSPLLSRGIETPEPVAYIEERRGGLLQECYFVSIQCPYSHLLYEVKDMDESSYTPLATALGAFAARMHKAEVYHRDFSPGNILWEKTQDGYRFSIVDINRMRFGNVSIDLGCRNFARLWGPRRFFSVAAREYARQMGYSEDECEQLVLKYRKTFWSTHKDRNGNFIPTDL